MSKKAESEYDAEDFARAINKEVAKIKAMDKDVQRHLAQCEKQHGKEEADRIRAKLNLA
jgi:cell division protein FtsN